MSKVSWVGFELKAFNWLTDSSTSNASARLRLPLETVDELLRKSPDRLQSSNWINRNSSTPGQTLRNPAAWRKRYRRAGTMSGVPFAAQTVGPTSHPSRSRNSTRDATSMPILFSSTFNKIKTHIAASCLDLRSCSEAHQHVQRNSSLPNWVWRSAVFINLVFSGLQVPLHHKYRQRFEYFTFWTCSAI